MKKLISISFALSLCVPVLASAQAVQRQGIFDCNQNGAYSMSVGALSAIGGVYVPVNDAAVTLNTGTLVYKECVLREVVDREREAALSALLKQMTAAIQTGRNGQARYVVNQAQEEADVTDKETLTALQKGMLDSLNPSLKSNVQNAIARGYRSNTRNKTNVLTCPYQGDLTALTTGARGSFSFEGLSALGDPACNKLNAYYETDNLVVSEAARALEYQRNQWDWGSGYYSLTDNSSDPSAEKILTPASNIQQSYQQMLGSPVRQLESANDIGQMIGALYAGVTTQILSDSGGLTGITQGSAGQASYLDQVAKESSAGLIGAAVNVALNNLNTARSVEAAYNQLVKGLGASLANTATQLRNAENQCWAVLVPAVQSYADANGSTDTDAPATPRATIRVATSTVFSTRIIEAQINGPSATMAAEITKSDAALTRIDQLIAGVRNTNSPTAQERAIAEISALVSSGALHTPTQLQAMADQKSKAEAALTGLVQDTVANWAGTGIAGAATPANIPWDKTFSPGIGWCNYRNATTQQEWVDVWKI